ncbi:hypothetical protein FB645_001800 [Coemansia sp. IMI 203386]|nr:hypothetical protein FB645_001800 [Coemansia sp. IMI 203386]
MSELIIYEDSPLAQYLQEVEAAEASVVENPPQNTVPVEQDTAETLEVHGLEDKQSGLILGSFANGSLSYKLLVFSLLESSINILGNSGLMAERYTPKPLAKAYLDETPFSIATHSLLDRRSKTRMVAQLVVPSAIGGSIAFKTAASGTKLHSALCALLLAGIGAIGISLSTSIFRQIRLDSTIKKASGFRNKLLETVRVCRKIDSMIQRCIKNIQEVEFIYKGFRLPNYAGALNISAAPGQGALWVASHLCQTVNKVLANIANTMLGLLNEAEELPADVLCAVSEYRKQLETIDESETPTLDMTRLHFDIYFALRRIWLQSMLSSLDTLATSDPEFKSTSIFLDRYTQCLTLVSSVCSEGMSTIKTTQEAGYASKRWETMVSGQCNTASNIDPLTRSLSSMSETIEIIQTKLCICSDYMDQVDQSVPSDDVARVFSSLKADIDLLNIRYQSALTALVCDKQRSLSDDFAASFEEHGLQHEDDTEILPEGTRVFGYTPLDSENLDAPSLEFEADLGSEQEPDRTKRPVLDRNERIIRQKEKREKEQQRLQQRNEVRSMLFELKSAIEIRSSSKDSPNNSVE